MIECNCMRVIDAGKAPGDAGKAPGPSLPSGIAS
jgi:hypothetical protein